MIESIETCNRFDKYFNRAILEWPEKIEVKKIIFTVDDKSIFSTIDMYKLYEEISDKYLGGDEEVLMVHIHECIYKIMHMTARYTSVIRPRDLRRSEVREIFEGIISSLSREYGWRDQDFAMVEAYFSEK